MALQGFGFSSLFSSGSSSGGIITGSVKVPVVLDSNGRASISLTNANTYKFLGLFFQDDPSGQSGGYRINKTSTSTLQVQADILSAAYNLNAVIEYSA